MDGGEDEGQGGVDGEGDVGSGSKCLVNGVDQGLGLEEGGEGHQEEENYECCAKPRRPFIMTGQQFDR